jgi:hypothetical protein
VSRSGYIVYGGKTYGWNEKTLSYNQVVVAELPNAVPEHHHANPLAGARKDESGGKKRVTVCFTRRACRVMDTDNAVAGAKFICDQLRYAGLIPGDSPAEIDFQFRQEWVSKKAEQGTLIEITT